ncbi:hypothetical protein GJ496_002019 [Pomphorhynchus laevis]|nr:hypothetical protein GJ496_002019 [Pomphorhynchus laevis]
MINSINDNIEFLSCSARLEDNRSVDDAYGFTPEGSPLYSENSSEDFESKEEILTEGNIVFRKNWRTDNVKSVEENQRGANWVISLDDVIRHKSDSLVSHLDCTKDHGFVDNINQNVMENYCEILASYAVKDSHLESVEDTGSTGLLNDFDSSYELKSHIGKIKNLSQYLSTSYMTSTKISTGSDYTSHRVFGDSSMMRGADSSVYRSITARRPTEEVIQEIYADKWNKLKDTVAMHMYSEAFKNLPNMQFGICITDELVKSSYIYLAVAAKTKTHLTNQSHLSLTFHCVETDSNDIPANTVSNIIIRGNKIKVTSRPVKVQYDSICWNDRQQLLFASSDISPYHSHL